MQYYPPHLHIIFFLSLGIPASASFRDMPCEFVFDPRHGRAPVCQILLDCDIVISEHNDSNKGKKAGSR